MLIEINKEIKLLCCILYLPKIMRKEERSEILVENLQQHHGEKELLIDDGTNEQTEENNKDDPRTMVYSRVESPDCI